jgi:hypothetical protein
VQGVYDRVGRKPAKTSFCRTGGKNRLLPVSAGYYHLEILSGDESLSPKEKYASSTCYDILGTHVRSVAELRHSLFLSYDDYS